MPTHTPEHRARNAARERRRRPNQDSGQRSALAQDLIQTQVDRRTGGLAAGLNSPQGAPPFNPQDDGAGGVVNLEDIQDQRFTDVRRLPVAPQAPADPAPRTEFDVLLNTVPGSELQQQELARVRAQQPEVVSAPAPVLEAPRREAAPSPGIDVQGSEDQEVEASGQEVMLTLQQNPALVQRLRQLPPESRQVALQNLLMNRMRVRQLSSLRVV